MRAVVLLAMIAGPLVLPPAWADQSVASGPGKSAAPARIDFRIVIPQTIALRADATAAAANANGPSRVLGGRAMTSPGGVKDAQGVQLQSDTRAVVLSRKPGSPVFVTASSP